MRRTISIVVLMLAIQALLVLGYVALRDSRQRAAAIAERLTQAAPELGLWSPAGGKILLSDYRGTPVVLHFWASWCPPCRAELPVLLDFARSAEAEVLAVSVDPEWEAVSSFFGNDSPASVWLASPEEVAESFDVVDLPQTFVIDRSGLLRLRFHGPRDWDSREIRSLVREIVEE